MTREIQLREREGRADDIFHVLPPWAGFRSEVEAAVYGENGVGGIFVSRAERRRARGKAHDATVKQIREIDGQTVVFERKAIEKLTDKDLEKIPTPEPYGKIVDPAKLRNQLVESLRVWIAAGKPKDDELWPRSPKGDKIRKVRVATSAKVGVLLSGGTVDRGEMARVDVFRKADKKGRYQYFLVPVYPHEIATMDAPPMRAVLAHAPEKEWPMIDQSYEFLWSVYQKSWIQTIKSSGEVVEGYFLGMDRSTGAIGLSAQANPNAIHRGIGVKTLSSFKKFTVDRLGRISEIRWEIRTWRGAACI
jgi:CRISPR-associated endonuclease Csn1